eukprot:4898202-Prymnesium_polylepis.2
MCARGRTAPALLLEGRATQHTDAERLRDLRANELAERLAGHLAHEPANHKPSRAGMVHPLSIAPAARPLDDPLHRAGGRSLHIRDLRHTVLAEVVGMLGVDEELEAALVAKNVLDRDVCLAVLAERGPVVGHLVVVLELPAVHQDHCTRWSFGSAD